MVSVSDIITRMLVLCGVALSLTMSELEKRNGDTPTLGKQIEDAGLAVGILGLASSAILQLSKYMPKLMGGRGAHTTFTTIVSTVTPTTAGSLSTVTTIVESTVHPVTHTSVLTLTRSI